MKRIVDHAIYEKHVSPTNKSLVNDFLIEKKAQGKAKSTLQQYQWDLRIILYLIYKHFENKGLVDLTRKNIRNLCIIFQEMNMSNARVNGLMSALRAALELCADDDYDYEFNVGSRVKGLPKNPVLPNGSPILDRKFKTVYEVLPFGGTSQGMYQNCNLFNCTIDPRIDINVLRSNYTDFGYPIGSCSYAEMRPRKRGTTTQRPSGTLVKTGGPYCDTSINKIITYIGTGWML